MSESRLHNSWLGAALGVAPGRCIMPGRGLRVSVLVAAVGFTAGLSSNLLASELPGRWVEARSPNFVVVGNATEKRTREIAHELERIRELFRLQLPGLEGGGRPLPVYAARNERTLKVFLPGLGRRRDQVAGLFVASPVLQRIYLRADLGGEQEMHVVYHEYFHYLAHSAGLDLPLWLSEGLADFWGATRLTADEAEIGQLQPHRLATLRNETPLPLTRLLAADHSSPEYRNEFRARIFYAQSWALVHYLMIGNEGAERAGQLRKYLELVAGGRGSLAAATEAFGDLKKLETQLRRYIRSLTFRFARMPAPASPAAQEVTVRPLEEPEAAARVALALLDMQPEEAKELVALAVADAPDLAETQVARALSLLFEKKAAEAASAFEMAIQRPGCGPIAHYGLAVSQLMQDRSTEGLAVAERSLLAAIALDSDYAPAYSRLAEVYWLGDEDKRRALAMIRRARKAFPNDTGYKLREARILETAGDREAARAQVQDLLAGALASDSAMELNNLCWAGSLAGFAASMMPACEKAVKLAPKSFAYLDSRAVARILAGDLPGAAIDLRAALRLSKGEMSERFRSTRQSWLASLERGESPFADVFSTNLAFDPNQGIGWGM